MTRIAAVIWLTAVAIAVVGLYHVKYQVQQLELELEQEQRSLREQQEALQVLQAEWTYLNRPARVAALAERHLGLAPLPASHVVPLDALPLRAPSDDAAGAPPLDATPAVERKIR